MQISQIAADKSLTACECSFRFVVTYARARTRVSVSTDVNVRVSAWLCRCPGVYVIMCVCVPQDDDCGRHPGRVALSSLQPELVLWGNRLHANTDSSLSISRLPVHRMGGCDR